MSLTYLPGLVRSYAQAHAWKDSPVGRDLAALLERHNLRILTWVWQGGSIAAGGRPVVGPEDVRGIRIRGAGREMEQMLATAGAQVIPLHSNLIGEHLKAAKLDAAVASSTTMITLRLQDSSRAVTTARSHSFWFILQPLLASRAFLDALPPDQRAAVIETGALMEPFAREAVQADDERLAQSYLQANELVSDMDAAAFEEWRRLARATAWREFEKTVKDGSQWIEKALAVP